MLAGWVPIPQHQHQIKKKFRLAGCGVAPGAARSQEREIHTTHYTIHKIIINCYIVILQLRL